jgi:hypothetical protein
LCFPRKPGNIKSIFHKKKHIDIVWLRFTGNERPENYKPGQVSRGSGHMVNPLQPSAHSFSLTSADAKPIQYVLEKGRMDPEGEIASFG